MVHDPTIPDSEYFATFHVREEAIIRERWTMLTTAEIEAAVRHIHESDFPGTVSDMIVVDRMAGFSSDEQLYFSVANIQRMFIYRP